MSVGQTLLTRGCQKCLGRGFISRLEAPLKPWTEGTALQRQHDRPKAKLIQATCPACHGRRYIMISTTVH